MTSRRRASPIRAVDHHPTRPPHLLASLGLAFILAPVLGGCMSVYITDARGDLRIERGVGLLRVELTGAKQTVVGSVEGFGLVSDPLGWSAGYTRQHWAWLADDCRAVVWPGPGGLDKRTREALARAAAVCLVGDEAGSTLASHPLPLTEGTP